MGDDGELMDIPQRDRYSSRDLFQTMKTWPQSRILKCIIQPVKWLTIWSAIVCACHYILPLDVGISGMAHGLLGSSLSLLLVFRTNAAYNRFQEGRKVWDKVSADVRSIARYLLCYAEVFGKTRTNRLTNMLCCFPVLLQEHIQGRRSHLTPLQKGVEKIIADDERLTSLQRCSNRPLHLLNLMSMEIRAVKYQSDKKYESRDRLHLYGMLAKLSETVSASERLVQTPVPLSYIRHTSRFLALFMLTLPFVLVRDYGLLTIPIVFLASWAMFGIQEIGLLIEEPFRTILALKVFCSTIVADVIEIVHAEELAEKRLEWSRTKDVDEATDGAEAPVEYFTEEYVRLLTHSPSSKPRQFISVFSQMYGVEQEDWWSKKAPAPEDEEEPSSLPPAGAHPVEAEPLG